MCQKFKCAKAISAVLHIIFFICTNDTLGKSKLRLPPHFSKPSRNIRTMYLLYLRAFLLLYRLFYYDS